MQSQSVSASDHPVKSVTVYKSGKAEIVRTFKLDLKVGQNKVEIKKLPTCIDTDSVRVSGLSAQTRLFDVVCTLASLQSAGRTTSPGVLDGASSEVVRVLRARKSALESDRRVRDHEAELLVSYGKTLGGEHITPAVMSQFLQTFVEQGSKNTQAITEIDEKIHEIEVEIKKVIKDSTDQKRATRGEVSVVIVAEEAINVDLTLTYIVSNAQWQPAYELHASTTNGKPSPSVSFHYRARINQSTGEDWSDAALTLSTNNAGMVIKTVPALHPLHIRPRFGAFFPQNINNNNKGPTGGGLFGPPQPSIFQHNQASSNVSQQSQRSSLFGQSQAFGSSGSSNTSGGGQASTGFGSSNAFGGNSTTFGSTSTPNPNPAFGGLPPQPASLFGSSSTSGFGSSAPQTGGLFGSSTPGTFVAQPTGAFGSTPVTSVVGGNAGSGGFGSSTNVQPSTGFGSSAIPTASFGASAAAPGSTGSNSDNSGWLNTGSNVNSTTTAPLPDEDDFEEIAIPAPSAEPETIVTSTPIAVSYSVPGQCTIPSDGENHQVALAVLDFKAKIEHVTVPRMEPAVYLQCEVKNNTEYRLLPGPVSVILDESYVSKTHIPDINTGDTFTFTLGTDPTIKLTYSRTAFTVKPQAATFAESFATTTYKTLITIHNKHTFAVNDLVVRDVLPTTQEHNAAAAGTDNFVNVGATSRNNNRIKVVLRKPEGLAEAKAGALVKLRDGIKAGWQSLASGGELEGKYEWRCEKIEAGGKITLEAEWEVRAPADTQWCEVFVNPNAVRFGASKAN